MRILQLTSYPTINPMHGGQIRCSQIAKKLRSIGHVVKSVAVYCPEDYAQADIDSDDISVDKTSNFFDQTVSWLSDYYSGIYLEKDPQAFNLLEKIFNDFLPDVIFCEQPWVFSAAKKLTKKTVKLVYSSQNVEWRLREKLFERQSLKGYDQLLEQIKDTELYAVKNSNLTIGCTQSDIEYYRQFIDLNLSEQPIVAGNGVEPFVCTEDRVEQWRMYFTQPFPVFVSSAHIPNAQGFWDFMAPGLTFLRPGEQILVLGGVTNILTQLKGFQQFADLNLSRLNMAGLRSKIELQELIRASHVVLLPISEGEGSNLKTAEALESNCYIIGSSKAFRGFEKAMSLPHVTIADNAEDFRKAIRKTLELPRNIFATPNEIRTSYYWDHQLNEIEKAFPII